MITNMVASLSCYDSNRRSRSRGFTLSNFYNGALLVLINLSLICDSSQQREGVVRTTAVEGSTSGVDHVLDISMPDVRPTQVC